MTFLNLNGKEGIKYNKENYYIIDTNVFVDYPDIISKIDRKYPIILSAKVTDELDKMKIKLTEERRQNAEKALRNLNNESQHEILYEFSDTSYCQMTLINVHLTI